MPLYIVHLALLTTDECFVYISKSYNLTKPSPALFVIYCSSIPFTCVSRQILRLESHLCRFVPDPPLSNYIQQVHPARFLFETYTFHLTSSCSIPTCAASILFSLFQLRYPNHPPTTDPLKLISRSLVSSGVKSRSTWCVPDIDKLDSELETCLQHGGELDKWCIK